MPALAGAQDLVTNGGAEDGTTSGWTTPATSCGAPSVFNDAATAHSGSYSFQFSGADCFQGIEQTLTVTPDQGYQVSLWAYTPTGDLEDNTLRFFFGNEQIFEYTVPAGRYLWIAGDVSSPHASVILRIEASNAVASTFVDDITIVSRASFVPEPTSLALLGTGLIGLVPLMRRRRQPERSRGNCCASLPGDRP